VLAAGLAGLGTWFLTALGALGVFATRTPSRRTFDIMLGFAGGVMVAASCWSLLIPAIDTGGLAPAMTGLLGGALFLFVLDKVLPHLHPQHTHAVGAEGPSVSWEHSMLLVVAITLHNIPEGLAIGVAFGGGDFGAATALAIGIGLQNIPEGLAVSLPLRREGLSRIRAFWYGQLSALVEPVAAASGAALVQSVSVLLPYALAFAAGAMLYVVVEELVPEVARGGNVDHGTLGFMLGFAAMVTLDNAFS
jgi:ZIP family zinc transporter